MLVLNYDQVHEYQEQNSNVFWEGWDLILFNPTPAGALHFKGEFRNGQWGISTRVRPNSDGRWRIESSKVRN